LFESLDDLLEESLELDAELPLLELELSESLPDELEEAFAFDFEP
jgi:hypothetical protein